MFEHIFVTSASRITKRIAPTYASFLCIKGSSHKDFRNGISTTIAASCFFSPGDGDTMFKTILELLHVHTVKVAGADGQDGSRRDKSESTARRRNE